jgi:CelD/BcsL family acetyltransferase involved in cellulose biosynthesis
MTGNNMVNIPESGMLSGLELSTDDAAGISVATSAQLHVLTQFDTAMPVWRKMIQNGAVFSGYQNADWVACWWAHVGVNMSEAACVAVLANDAGQPVLLLPLVRQRIGLLNVGFYAGGKHSNFNVPVWHPGRLADIDRPMDELLTGLKGGSSSIDMMVLLNQPAAWSGFDNPLMELPHFPSSSSAYSGQLQDDYEALLQDRVGSSTRKKLRQKERRIAGSVEVSYWRAKTSDQVNAVVDAFLQQKAARMVELGVSNVFVEPGVEPFIREAALTAKSDSDDPVIETYAMSVGDEIVATFGGTVAGERCYGMFNSMTNGELRVHSPGELLLANVIRMCCERGLKTFDLGVGDAAYKQVFCNDVEQLFDSVIPISAIGHAVAPAWRGALAAKRRLKKSEIVMQVRRRFGRSLTRGE